MQIYASLDDVTLSGVIFTFPLDGPFGADVKLFFGVAGRGFDPTQLPTQQVQLGTNMSYR